MERVSHSLLFRCNIGYNGLAFGACTLFPTLGAITDKPSLLMARAKAMEEERAKRKQKTMTGEEEEEEDTIAPSIPKKPKKKKPKKDKWGQPLPSAEAVPEELEQPEAAATAEEKEEEQGYETKKVVVSGMPYSTTAEAILSFFEGAGNITQMRMSTFPDTGNFRGLAFLTFKTAEAASKSLELDGTNMGGRVIRVERCRLDQSKKKKTEFLGDPEKEEGYNAAYIGNLAWDVREDDIRAFLGQSKIESIRLAVNKKTGKFRGFGHIDFADDDSLEKAILKNQEEFYGRPVKISYAVRNKN